MGPGSWAVSTIVTEELIVTGADCANAGAPARERPSTTIKRREEAQDGTRREIGIWLPRADSAEVGIFFASRIIQSGAHECLSRLGLRAVALGCGSSLSATVVWFPEYFFEGFVCCGVFARCLSPFLCLRVLPSALRRLGPVFRPRSFPMRCATVFSLSR